MTEKKRFEKAISQLDSAFQKANSIWLKALQFFSRRQNLSKEFLFH